MFENVTICELYEAVNATKPRSAWNKGVKLYALDLLEDLSEAIKVGDCRPVHLLNATELHKALLNGAKDYRAGEKDWWRHWRVYSWGGSSLIYDGDIAKRLCTPSELRKTDNGNRQPSSREDWLDVQGRALFQAAAQILTTARELSCKEG